MAYPIAPTIIHARGRRIKVVVRRDVHVTRPTSCTSQRLPSGSDLPRRSGSLVLSKFEEGP